MGMAWHGMTLHCAALGVVYTVYLGKETDTGPEFR